ncbi:MAG: co-chaperone DjlA [Kangiellaceae bacterium]|jgi:DnaJ like chaperone protein|nr:co-chaperone DjlA [Kangiellaceae bacterium]
MSWWGKLIGGALGFSVGGPLGAAMGAMLGHSFDKGVDQDFGSASSIEQVQAAFFTATFTVMGKLAKADGRVSENEIAAARQVMEQMGLTDQLKKSAIDLFNQGKADSFDWRGSVEQFNQIAGRQKNLKQMFLEIQIQAAMADGSIDRSEQELLAEITAILRFSPILLQQLIAMVQAQNYFHQGGGQSYQQHASQVHSATKLQQAYALLGVNKDDDDKLVKKAYRRLMSQHHPDKLVAKGLPEEMIKMATEKTQEIKMAYETIIASRR